MESALGTVLLFRQRKDGADPFVTALTSRGRQAVCVPVLGFDCTLKQEELCEALSGLAAVGGTYSGIILTSQRAVAALSLALLDGAGKDVRGRAAARAALAAFTMQEGELPFSTSVYVVGDQTASAFRDFAIRLVRGGQFGDEEGERGRGVEGGTVSETLGSGERCVLRKGLFRGAESGRAAELARLIVADYADAAGSAAAVAERKLLYLCGESRRDELPSALDAAGVQWDSITVYASTRLGSNIDTAMAQATASDGNLSAAVFFSPNGVQSVCENDELLALLKGGGDGKDGKPRPHLVGIGPTTSAALASSVLCRGGNVMGEDYDLDKDEKDFGGGHEFPKRVVTCKTPTPTGVADAVAPA